MIIVPPTPEGIAFVQLLAEIDARNKARNAARESVVSTALTSARTISDAA